MTGLLALALFAATPTAEAGPVLPANAAAGFSLERVGPRMRRYLGTPNGVLILETLEDSPAERAGLRAGDVVLELDGNTMLTPGQVSLAVSLHRGAPVDLVVFREGERYRTALEVPKREHAVSLVELAKQSAAERSARREAQAEREAREIRALEPLARAGQ